MKNELKIATARIEGIKELPYCSSNHGYFICSIYFSKSTSSEHQTCFSTKVGDTIEEAEKVWEQLKKL